ALDLKVRVCSTYTFTNVSFVTRDIKGNTPYGDTYGNRKHLTTSQPCFLCKNCGKAYRNQSTFSRHVNHECGKDPQFMCAVCLKRYKRKDQLKIHLKDVHSVCPE
ncbi:hypothetical protein ILUMI_20344, partial [Ignelater luminosus]